MDPSRLQGASYRKDIDGLRAIAILSVVAYHLGIPGASGGYVGVDVFFVISGYLITSLISREIDRGSFSLIRFYERRIRRILPALAALLIVSSIAAWVFLLPQEFADYSKSLLAAVASGSNILFWSQSGYFDGPSQFKPLLHTWTLGVEEQFYIFLPLLLMLISSRWKRYRSTWIACLALISFAISAAGVIYSPAQAFFLLDSRAWELLAGGMLALNMVPAIRSAVGRSIAGISGLCLMLIAVAGYTDSTPFPGIAAILPCLGAMLVIAAGQSGSSIVGRLLSLRPMVFVGLISYSLYLWHWPILVLARMGLLSWVSISRHYARVILLLEMLVVSILSWRFVEMPFRSGPRVPSRRFLFIAAGVTYAGIAAFALAIMLTGGMPNRYSPEAAQIATFQAEGGDRQAEREGTCMVDSSSRSNSLDVKDCLREESSKPNLLLFGDSHAAHLWYGLSTAFPELNVMQATAATCKPLIRVSKAAPYCQNLRDFIFAEYLTTHHIDGVILSAAWLEADLLPLGETLDALRSLGLKVYLVGPNPSYDEPLPRLLVRSRMKEDTSLPARHLVRFAWELDNEMRRLAVEKQLAGYISLVDAMCPEGKCIEYAEPLVPVECDGNHFSARGSIVIANNIRKAHGLPY
jgi:peptidoglycan/LPS O-acetylase OafA/YrhL